GGFGDHDGGELDDPALLDLAVVERLGQVSRCVQSEMRRHGLLEGRLRTPTVLAAGRRRDRRQADVIAAAPVAGHPTPRGVARLPSVGRDADAVDPSAADDRY